MRFILALAVTCLPAAAAAVTGVEYKFAPFVGNLDAGTVRLVPGTVRVFLNKVPIEDAKLSALARQPMFDNREVRGVWIAFAGNGSVRKGTNKIRFEFEPADPKAAYQTQLITTVWESDPDHPRAETEVKPARGKVTYEREFAGDFARDLPWHHYPPTTALSDADKQQIGAMLKARADAFRPDFSAVYKRIKNVSTDANTPGIKLNEVRQFQCFGKAYAAGVRVNAPPPETFEIVVTGSQEVVVRGKGGRRLFFNERDVEAFQRIRDDATQMCAGAALAAAYPSELTIVRTPAGKWEEI